MIERIGFAVGMLVALGFPAPAVAQDAPPLQRPPAPSLTFSGSLRLEYFARDSAIEELRSRLAGFTGPRGDDTFLSADARVRFDARLPDVRVTSELAVLPYDDGANRGLGAGDSEAILKQLFADLEGFLAPDFTLRAGAFEYAWRIRPHGEPFLLDLGRAESFFSGAGDRDLNQAAGALLKWRAGDFVEIEALWMTSIEGGSASSDESPIALLVNFPLGERSAVFLGALHVAGEGAPRVTTWGGGADWYFGPDRELELFGEGWMQAGRISRGVSRRAWAAQAGARVVTGDWRTEVSGAWRSGDDDPADGREETFQSYEGQERFRIVESAEFGLDWDVNLSSIRFSLARRLGESADARLDAARFQLSEPVAGFDRDLGIEVDGSVTWECSRAVAAWIAGAILFGSDTLEESSTLLITLGLKALW